MAASVLDTPDAVLDLTAEECIEYYALLSCPCSLCPRRGYRKRTVTYIVPMASVVVSASGGRSCCHKVALEYFRGVHRA